MDCRDRSGAAGRPKKKRHLELRIISSVTGRVHRASGDFGRVFAPIASYSRNLVSGPCVPCTGPAGARWNNGV